MRWIWVRLKKILDAGQSWLVVSLVGASKYTLFALP